MEAKSESKSVQKSAIGPVVSQYSLGSLPDGAYLIGRVAVPTELRRFVKDGKESFMFVTTLYADGGLYEFTQFAPAPDAVVTDRGDAIRKLNIGERVLFHRNAPMRDKASGRTQVEKLFGKVLDAQQAA